MAVSGWRQSPRNDKRRLARSGDNGCDATITILKDERARFPTRHFWNVFQGQHLVTGGQARTLRSAKSLADKSLRSCGRSR